MNDAGHNEATVRRTAAAIHPVMVKLSEYMSGAADRALPAAVITETKHHILDTIAAMVSGADLVPGGHALRFAREYGGEKIATVVASDVLMGPIEAIQLIRQRRPFDPDEIRSIAVRVSTSAADKIDDSVMANLSMQYLIAVTLIDGTLSFKAAHDDTRMRDPAVVRQKAKIKVIADESLERLLPARVAVVEVTFNDGTVISERNDTVRGSPGNPMSSEEVAAKARDLIAPVLGAERCALLIDRIFALEAVGTIGELRPLLQRAGTDPRDQFPPDRGDEIEVMRKE